jgi:hypothetical protein
LGKYKDWFRKIPRKKYKKLVVLPGKTDHFYAAILPPEKGKTAGEQK